MSARGYRQRVIRVGLALCCAITVPCGPADAQDVQAGTAGASTDGFTIAPRGYVQFDWRGFPDWPVAPGTGRLDRDTLEVRRARVGVDGTWGRLSYELTVDPAEADGVDVRDAYGQWRVSRALRVRIGQFKLPGSREYGRSARTLDYLERSALALAVAPGRDIGAMATGRLGRRLGYEAGLFAGDGNGRRSRAGFTGAARAEWALASEIEIAGYLTAGRTSAVETDPANGLEGRSSSGYRFFERVYVDGRRVRTGVDAAWTPGRWRLTAEYLRAEDARDGQGLDLEDLPSVVAQGWSAEVARAFGRRSGGARSQLREFDLGLRVDALGLDDSGPETTADSVRPRATDIRPRGARTVTTSVSWRPVRWARVIGQAGLERFTDSRSAPEPGNPGTYFTFGTRLQFELP